MKKQSHVHRWEVWPVRYPKQQESRHAIARCKCGARINDTEIERILNSWERRPRYRKSPFTVPNDQLNGYQPAYIRIPKGAKR